jgi:hypothetical protein
MRDLPNIRSDPPMLCEAAGHNQLGSHISENCGPLSLGGPFHDPWHPADKMLHSPVRTSLLFGLFRGSGSLSANGDLRGQTGASMTCRRYSDRNRGQRRAVTRWTTTRLAVTLVVAIGFTGPADVCVADRPNVVLVMTDDQGFGDVGVHGNDKIRTPHIDRFSKQGVTFTRFYCSPVCAPTRASLMTGRYYYRTGVVHTSRGGAKMQADEVTLAEMLSKAGYATGLFGKWHLGDNYPMRPIDQGFDEVLCHASGGIGQTPDKPNSYFDPLLWHNGRPYKSKGYCTDIFTNAAIEFIKSNRNRPFFVYLSTNTPHTQIGRAHV